MKGIWKNYLTDDEIKILLFIVIFGIIGIGLKYTSLIAKDEAGTVQELDISKDYEIKYDLLTVTKQELISIPGIGEKRAADILSYRDQHGFSSNTDLMLVKGIGTATFKKIENYFQDFGPVLDMPFSETKQQPDQTDPAIDKGSRVNINTASVEELIQLKGIGKTKAEAIIEYRKINKEFQKVDDLIKVKGIGEKTLDKIREKICIGVDDE